MDLVEIVIPNELLGFGSSEESAPLRHRESADDYVFSLANNEAKLLTKCPVLLASTPYKPFNTIYLRRRSRNALISKYTIYPPPNQQLSRKVY